MIVSKPHRSPAVVFCGALLLATACSAPQPTAGPINVLFIIIDDLNTALGSYGDPLARTPNLDRLAARGVRFDRAYVQYPICNPSRTSILSGRYPETTRILRNRHNPNPAVDPSKLLTAHFERHGYQVSQRGKVFHNSGDPATAIGLGEQAAAPAAVQPFESWTPDEREAIMAARSIPLSFHARRVDDHQIGDGRLARWAATILSKRGEAPFFLAVGFSKPHVPYSAPVKYFEGFSRTSFRLPREPEHHLDDVPRIALTHLKRETRLPSRQEQRFRLAYYACVRFIDAQVGLLLDVMDRESLWETTVVVVLSDHGYHLGEHQGLWRKGTLFEQAVRVPMIIAAPGMPAGTTVRSPVETLDLYPTLTELAHIPSPDGLQGTSLAPLLRDPDSRPGGLAYSIVRRLGGSLGRSIRSDRYRYTEWEGEALAQLYDHEEDPYEYVNLFTDPAHGRTVARMKKLLQERRRVAGGASDEAP